MTGEEFDEWSKDADSSEIINPEDGYCDIAYVKAVDFKWEYVIVRWVYGTPARIIHFVNGQIVK